MGKDKKVIQYQRSLFGGKFHVLGPETKKIISNKEIDDIEEFEKVEAKKARNTLNNLSGREWLFFTKTLLTTAYKSEYGHKLRAEHGANKPPRLMAELIKFFTKRQQIVLDPFCGVGGTLIGASITERKAIGIELNPRWIDIYKQVCDLEGIEEQETIAGDSAEILKILGEKSTLLKKRKDKRVDFIATDPPYNLNFERTMSGVTPLSKSKSAQHKYRRTDYESFSNLKEDLSNVESTEEFLRRLRYIIALMFPILKPGKYMTMIIRNAYQDGRYQMTHAKVAEEAEKIGFILKGEIIWYQAGTRLRPYGYPNSYVPNIAHNYILVFQRPKK